MTEQPDAHDPANPTEPAEPAEPPSGAAPAKPTAPTSPLNPASESPSGAGRADPVTILDMVWPETGLPVSVRVNRRPKDTISEDDVVHLELDFVTLAISPLEFIQLAASLRMSVDALLDQHPGLQRAVIAAFDLRRDDR